MAERHYDVKGAAPLLYCSPSLVYALCKGKKLRHVRVGLGRGKCLIPESAIAEYLAQQTVAVDQPVPERRFRHVRLP